METDETKVVPEGPFLEGVPYIHDEDKVRNISPRLVVSAILLDDKLWTGVRHFNIIRTMDAAGVPSPIPTDAQGFLTENGVFVRRKPAKMLAIKSGQIPEDHSRVLLSEDLW